MKKLLLLIALLLPALFVTAQGIKNGLKEEPKINVGIKGGFNSSMYFTSRLELDGERMEDVQNNYKGTFIKYYKISQLIHTQSIAN